MIRTISVIYSNRRLSPWEIDCGSFKKYAFLCAYDCVKVGDIISSPMYTTNMQVVEITNKQLTEVNGRQTKHILIDSIEHENGQIDMLGYTPDVLRGRGLEAPKNVIKESTINTNQNSNKMEKKSMFNSIIEKFKSQFIPEKDETLKMSMDGNICVPVNGDLVSIDTNNNLISYPSEMCIDVPVFLISKPYAQVQVGDIIKINSSFAKVLKKNANGSLSCLSYSGYTSNKKEIKDFVLGQAFIKVVVNMFSNLQASGFNPMMLAMADDNMSMKDLMMIQMMQGNNSQMNPMMMLALMDNKDGDNNSMFETMMMMQMMQGGQMGFPFMNNNK